jgi:hypothetical protein
MGRIDPIANRVIRYAQKLIIAQSERSNRANAATPPMGRLYLFSSYAIALEVSNLVSVRCMLGLEVHLGAAPGAGKGSRPCDRSHDIWRASP